MKKTGFQQFMEKGALICLVMTTVFLSCWLIFGSVVLFSLMITFGTILYHFVVRIAVGAAVDRLTAGGVNYHAAWFRQSGSEKKLFRLMNVHRWKLKLPTYTPEKFSLKDNTPEQVVMNMCAAELIHEINIVASFVPVLMSIVIPVLRETMLVFVLTSIATAVFDLLFVIIQRYNRPRMMRLIQRKNRSALNN